jgi:outer membrane protein assembly factor BamB
MTIRMASFAVTLTLIVSSGGLAQMGGGMGHGGGLGNGPAPGMAGGMSMSGGMGIGSGMMNDVAVGPDGTAYMLRRTGQPQRGGMMQPGGTSQIKAELVAIDGISGAEKWKVSIDAEMVSEPAFAKDGRLFVTAADVLTTGSGTTTTVSRKARLLVIKPGGTGATVTSTDVESDVLSAPRIAPDESVVYATGFEMVGFMAGSDDNDSVPAGQTDLYAFNIDGTRRFKVTIGRAQFNMPPR